MVSKIPVPIKEHLIAQFLCCANVEATLECKKYKFKVFSCMAKDGAFAQDNHYLSIAKYIQNVNTIHPQPYYFDCGHLIFHFCADRLTEQICLFMNDL